MDKNNTNTKTNTEEMEIEVGGSWRERTQRSGSVSSLPESTRERNALKKRKLPQEEEKLGNTYMEEVYKVRQELEDFVFNESNKVSKNVIKFIFSKWAILETKVGEEIVEKEKWKSAYQSLTTKPSYADVAMSGVSFKESGVRGTAPETKRREISKSHEVVIIKPEKEEDIRTNEEIKTQVLQEFEGIKSKLKIKGIRQMRRKGIVIEVDDKKDAELIKRANLDRKGLKIEEPQRVLPSIVIYDVEVDMDETQLKHDLIHKNLEQLEEQEKNSLENKIVLKHKYKINEGRVNWIVQIPGKYYNRIIKQGRIYLQWRTYKIKDYIGVTRCFKCQGYGHIAKTCNSPDQICEICGGKDHLKKDCGQKDKVQCINCTRSRRKDNKHSTKSKDCPEYIKQAEIYKSRLKWD